MIQSITFLKDFRGFRAGEELDFTRNGFERTILLAGLNGCGKSTLLNLIADEVGAVMGSEGGIAKRIGQEDENIIKIKTTKPINARLFQAEYDKKRGMTGFDYNDPDLDVGFHLSAMRMSHGEALFFGLNRILDNMGRYNTFLLDEPDQASSIRIASMMGNVFRKYPLKFPGVQIIAAVHHPMIMTSNKFVYDVVKREYRTARSFIGEMRKPGPLGFGSRWERK